MRVTAAVTHGDGFVRRRLRSEQGIIAGSLEQNDSLTQPLNESLIHSPQLLSIVDALRWRVTATATQQHNAVARQRRSPAHLLLTHTLTSSLSPSPSPLTGSLITC